MLPTDLRQLRRPTLVPSRGEGEVRVLKMTSQIFSLRATHWECRSTSGEDASIFGPLDIFSVAVGVWRLVTPRLLPTQPLSCMQNYPPDLDINLA